MCTVVTTRFWHLSHKSIISLLSKIRLTICYSYTMGCPPVRGDNPLAKARGLSYVQADKHGITNLWERSGSVVECLTQDRRAVGSSLTGVTALCP